MPPDELRKASDQLRTAPDELLTPPDGKRTPPDELPTPPDGNRRTSDGFLTPSDELRRASDGSTTRFCVKLPFFVEKNLTTTRNYSNSPEKRKGKTVNEIPFAIGLKLTARKRKMEKNRK
jgi:hypothetical protein